MSALRVINTPRRRIGQVTLNRLVAIAEREDMTLGEAANRAGLLERELPPAAVGRLREFFTMGARWRAAEPETSVPALLERIEVF